MNIIYSKSNLLFNQGNIEPISNMLVDSRTPTDPLYAHYLTIYNFITRLSLTITQNTDDYRILLTFLFYFFQIKSQAVSDKKRTKSYYFVKSLRKVSIHNFFIMYIAFFEKGYITLRSSLSSSTQRGKILIQKTYKKQNIAGFQIALRCIFYTCLPHLLETVQTLITKASIRSYQATSKFVCACYNLFMLLASLQVDYQKFSLPKIN